MCPTNPEPNQPSVPVFVTTHWTRVLQARGDSPDAKAAMSELCAAYYPPVFAFICRDVQDEESARDLTQEFFARLIAGHGVSGVDPKRGRFRSYLLGAVKHFLRDMRDRAGRIKRGSGQSLESTDAGTDTSPGLQVPDTSTAEPDREFDRKWALTLLDRALAILEAEHQAAGTHPQFELLKPWLAGEPGELSQAEAGARLGISEGAAKVAIHRLRRRFRNVVREEIGRTLNDPAQIDNEMACLIAALGGN
jgi:RNA polymerase sigma-70 factor (ECF subfamily)